MSTVVSLPSRRDRLLSRFLETLRAVPWNSAWFQWVFALLAVVYLAYLAVAQAGAINDCGHDVFLLLDGGWRILNGQVPHRDFYLVLGPLEYMLTAGGLFLANGGPRGLAYANVGCGIILGVWGWLLARRRMPIAVALIFTAWLILTATSPTPTGAQRSDLSFAMIYNRHGYGLLAIVLVECAFASQRSRFRGGVSSGIALTLLAFLKLNFFGAAGLLLLATFPVKKEELARLWGALAGIFCTVAAFAVFLRFSVSAFLFDMSMAVHVRSATLRWSHAFDEMTRNVELVMVVILSLLVPLLAPARSARRANWIRFMLLGLAVLISCALLSQTNTYEWSSSVFAVPWIILLVGHLAAAYPEAKPGWRRRRRRRSRPSDG